MVSRARTAAGTVLAATLVLLAAPTEHPSLMAAQAPPPRTVSVPRTLTRTTRMALPADAGRVHLGLRPSHIAFSWRGEEGTGVRFRTVADGVASGWRRAPMDHSVEGGTRRFTAVIAVDRPDQIVWRPVGHGSFMTDVTLDQINTLDGPQERVTLTAEDTPRATAESPKIVSRAQWGANESLKRTSGGCRRRFFRVQQLFVHHTAGSNALSNPKATMRAIYWFHVVRRGWCDVGYNFVIDRRGTVYEGRWARRYQPWEVHSSEDSQGRAVAGAHVSDFNSGSVGVSLMGNFERAPLPPSMRRSLARLLAWEVDRHDLRATGTHLYRNPETGRTRKLPFIAGHRDAGQTSCPGRYLYSALPGIRRDVKSVIGAGKAGTTMTFPLTPPDVAYGTAVALSGSLLKGDGTPVAGGSVRLWRKVSAERWKVVGETSTASDGSFSFTMSPETNRTVVAVFDGNAAAWGSQSGDVRIRVHPLVSVVPQGATPDPSGVYVYPTGTTAVSLAGTVTPPHSGRDVRVRVSQLQPDGTYADVVVGRDELDGAGAFEFTYAPATPGTYSAEAWLRRHKDHATGRSEPVFFTVMQ
jgi:hypothetical protein